MTTTDPQDAQSTLSELLTYLDSTTVGQMPVLTRLRYLRLRAAMTQLELAERSGVARTTIIRLEAGDPDALPPTVKKLAKALKVKTYELWEGPTE
jgi:DNA-binding XRE family transcriptional regulator